MDVTRWPHAFKSTPMLEAVTPLPSPLTTPPVTSTYFIVHPSKRAPQPGRSSTEFFECGQDQRRRVHV
jgi:hypothetical protein